VSESAAGSPSSPQTGCGGRLRVVAAVLSAWGCAMAAGARQSNSVGRTTWRTRQIGARCRDIEREGTQGIRIVNSDPDFLYVAPSMAACAAFIKESRIRFANATSSTGNQGEGPVYDMASSLPGAAARSCRGKVCAQRSDCYTDVCCLCTVADLAGPSA
jgi:hypothetical protein